MTKLLVLCASASLAAAACQGGGPADDVAIGSDAVESANGLTSNGLTSNGLTSNGLTSNGLTSNGLAAGKLVATTLTALRDKSATGDLTRTFFRYLVSCALPAGHDVSYSWTDALGRVHNEIAPGAFNLAPGWETGPLDLAGQDWVSACLFARTNSLGVSVPISIRADGPGRLATTAQERIDFSFGEGAFWGNLFLSPTPYGHSCSRLPPPPRGGASTSSDLSNGRTCATEGCGIITYVGPCFASGSATSGQACFQRDAINGDWVNGCTSTLSARQVLNPRVISTWLRP